MTSLRVTGATTDGELNGGIGGIATRILCLLDGLQLRLNELWCHCKSDRVRGGRDYEDAHDFVSLVWASLETLKTAHRWRGSRSVSRPCP